jgi:hypothetical protein
MKEANQQLLLMNFGALREYAMNIETSAINRGILSDDNDDQGDYKPKPKLDMVRKKNRWSGQNKNTTIKNLYWMAKNLMCALFCGIRNNTYD